MNQIERSMKKIGMYVSFLGVFTIFLNFVDRVPKILEWIYNWGEGIAWVIKIGFVVVGAAMFYWGRNKERKETQNNLLESTEEHAKQ